MDSETSNDSVLIVNEENSNEEELELTKPM